MTQRPSIPYFRFLLLFSGDRSRPVFLSFSQMGLAPPVEKNGRYPFVVSAFTWSIRQFPQNFRPVRQGKGLRNTSWSFAGVMSYLIVTLGSQMCPRGGDGGGDVSAEIASYAIQNNKYRSFRVLRIVNVYLIHFVPDVYSIHE